MQHPHTFTLVAPFTDFSNELAMAGWVCLVGKRKKPRGVVF